MQLTCSLIGRDLCPIGPSGQSVNSLFSISNGQALCWGLSNHPGTPGIAMYNVVSGLSPVFLAAESGQPGVLEALVTR